MSDLITFDPPEPSELSELLDGYHVSALVATGGMGAVYRATQISLDRDVAIKLLPRELGQDSFQEQFQAEARAMAKLNHPNLIGIYDFGRADGMPYIVMELVAGKSLYYSCYQKAIEQATACELIIEICEGLAHAHKAGIVHRDIKPANILLDPEGHAKIGDFGLASPTDGDNEAGIVFGTPGYAAPEILENAKAIGIPSDLFAVGVMLYELLTGHLPTVPPRPVSTVVECDPRLDRIVKLATRRNPRMRYQSAQDMADELKSLLPDIGSGGFEEEEEPVTTATGQVKLNRSGATGPVKLKRGGGTEPVRLKTPATKRTALRTPATGRTTLKTSATTKTGLRTPATGRTTLKTETSKQARLATAADQDELEDYPNPANPAAVPGTTVDYEKSGNNVILRNLLIIAILVPVLVFAFEKYRAKQERIATEEAAIQKKNSRDSKLKEDARKKELEAAAAAKRLKKETQQRNARIAAAHLGGKERSKNPLEQLKNLRSTLASGIRSQFPDGTMDRGTHKFFLIKEAMTWTAAAQFAEDHGGHLATPVSKADLSALSKRIGDSRRVWIGGGAMGRTDWGWVTGAEWVLENPNTNVGTYASLSRTGNIVPRRANEKNPFLIQWHKNGTNPGTLSGQLDRLKVTLNAPSPEWPPGTIVFQNRHYLLVHRPVSWDEADLLASGGSGHLAVASDQQEMYFINETLKKSLLTGECAWLGAQFIDSEWTWNTREPWSQASWRPGAPTGKKADNSLLYRNSEKKPGWDSVNSNDGAAKNFLIEWSHDVDDAAKKIGKAGKRPKNATKLVADLRKKGRNALNKKIKDHTKKLMENQKEFSWSISQWLKIAPLGVQKRHGNALTQIREALGDNGVVPIDLPVQGLPGEAQTYFRKALDKQSRLQKKFVADIDKLRDAYLAKLLAERKLLDNAGLRTQSKAVTKEMQSVGQTNASFRAHFGM